MKKNNISFRVNKKDLIMISELFGDRTPILFIANKITQYKKPLPDSGRDKTNAVIGKGLVRMRPSREWDISKFLE